MAWVEPAAPAGASGRSAARESAAETPSRQGGHLGMWMVALSFFSQIDNSDIEQGLKLLSDQFEAAREVNNDYCLCH